MINDQVIRRINELARKMKEGSLTDEERAEQTALRRQYIDAVRTSLRASLEQISFVDDNPKH